MEMGLMDDDEAAAVLIDDNEEADEERLHLVTTAALLVTAAEAARLFRIEQRKPSRNYLTRSQRLHIRSTCLQLS